jgi:hypothetical protein
VRCHISFDRGSALLKDYRVKDTHQSACETDDGGERQKQLQEIVAWCGAGEDA